MNGQDEHFALMARIYEALGDVAVPYAAIACEDVLVGLKLGAAAGLTVRQILSAHQALASEIANHRTTPHN